MRSPLIHSKMLGFALAVAVPCACGPTAVRDYQGSRFIPIEYGTQASRGDVPVVVIGSAAGLSGAPLSTAVVERMQGADWPPRAHFAPASAIARSAGDRMPYTYVLMFNGPRDITAAGLCARRSSPVTLPVASSTGSNVLVAGLCRYDEAVAGVTAWSPAISGPNDPMFRELIVSAIQELTRVPARNNNSSDGKGDK